MIVEALTDSIKLAIGFFLVAGSIIAWLIMNAPPLGSMRKRVKSWWLYAIAERYQYEREDGSMGWREATWTGKAANLWKWTLIILLVFPFTVILAIASIVAAVGIWVFGINYLIDFLVTL